MDPAGGRGAVPERHLRRERGTGAGQVYVYKTLGSAERAVGFRDVWISWCTEKKKNVFKDT